MRVPEGDVLLADAVHASMGKSCAVADVKADSATIWTASQGPHRTVGSVAGLFGLPRDKVRLIYLEGSGCYGMNGHEDAAADAAILSRAVGRPVRVQWTREDEHGWDPKGPPQLLRISRRQSGRGRLWTGAPRCGYRRHALACNIPLLGAEQAGTGRPRGIATGLIQQNGDPPYAADHIQVVVHWLKEAPLRPAPLRSPGKVGG